MEFTYILKNIKLKFSYYLGIILFLVSNVCLAQTIIIPPNTVISHSKSYNNVTLDLTNGSFIITNNATLTISNSIVNGNLSKNSPLLINVDKGNLSLSNNQFDIKSVDIAPHQTTQSLHYVIQIGMGGLNMTGNRFQIDEPFTAGLLITTSTLPTANINIVNNKFERFHGVLYLISTDNALISGNTFFKNSYGNLVVIGSNSKIIGNTIYFSGSNRLGNAIDVIDSNNILVSKNLILTPTCHGIYVFNSTDVVVDLNRISGGITYAMNILSNPETLTPSEYVKEIIRNHKMKNLISSNITITNNYMSQNRYGIAASDVNGLTVQNNIFIQRIEDNNARKFWTDNNVLLQNVTSLIWTNNLYKEAFTQAVGDNNSKSFSFVTFPQAGGVSL
jgi:parallel beta-helix repeat protein